MKYLIVTLLVLIFAGAFYFFNKLKQDEIIYKELGKINNYTLYKHEPEFCATALEVLYEDDENVYYFTCTKSSNYILKNSFKKISLKEALQKQIITINQLTKLEPNIHILSREEWYNSNIPAGDIANI